MGEFVGAEIYLNKKHPLFGLCYALSEAFYHVAGKKHGYRPCRLRYYGVCHWWLRGPNGENIDLTAGQYTRPFPYHRGVCGGWLTGEIPCQRTQDILMLLYVEHFERQAGVDFAEADSIVRSLTSWRSARNAGKHNLKA